MRVRLVFDTLQLGTERTHPDVMKRTPMSYQVHNALRCMLIYHVNQKGKTTLSPPCSYNSWEIESLFEQH